MRAPQYERASVISIAVDRANDLLRAPIDLIRIDGAKISVAAGGKMVTGTFGYSNAHSEDGSIMPGSGHWNVFFGEVHTSPAGWLARLLGKG